MSARAMMFIDGTWLGVNANRLANDQGLVRRPGGPLDYGAVPRVCAALIGEQLAGSGALDLVRTHYFGSVAINYDAGDEEVVQRRRDFFDSLRRQHRYEVYRYETDFRGGRVRRFDRADGDPQEPREKSVDVGLATALLEMAALDAYDIALVVCGDRDFVPALQAVRRLGKRVALVSAHGSCPREFSDPNDAARVRDFDMLWLDELWPRLVAPNARLVARPSLADAPPPAADGPVTAPARSTIGMFWDLDPFAAPRRPEPTPPPAPVVPGGDTPSIGP